MVTIKVKNIKFTLLLSLALVAVFAFKPGNGKGKVGTIKTIVIDAGHGGKDPGCNGISSKEKDVSLSVALKLGKLIEENMKDVKVIYTRTTDVFVDLEDRAQIANKAKADLFISIHCNAAGKVVKYRDPKTKKMRVKMRKNKKGKFVPVETTNPLPFGSETYVMGLKNEEGKMKVATRENSVIYLEDDYEKKYEGFDPDSEESYIIMSNYTSAYVIQSANLGLKIQAEYKSKAGRVDKGVHRQSIWVLWRTAMPSILTEIGYLTNPLEEEFLASEKGQDYISKSIFRGLRKYKDELEGNKKEYNDDIENQTPLENENIKAGHYIGEKAKDEEEEPEEEETKKDSTKTVKAGGKISPDSTIYHEKDLNTGIIGVIDSSKFVKATETKTATIKSPAQRTKEINDSLAKINTARFKFKTDSIAAAKAEIEKLNKAKNETKQDIAFKVQFASSETALNLKEKRFADIKNGAYYKVKTTYKYTSGNFASMSEASAHQAILRENGFKDCFLVAFKNGERIDVNEAKRLLEQKR
ncbi:MAG: N-acetylmuramoyl-L-alanine amidase [Bacteroidia bacterium]|nr:N-acetylmuramoyl-L-alanine amidase [Bacteroidia bacterium]